MLTSPSWPALKQSAILNRLLNLNGTLSGRASASTCGQDPVPFSGFGICWVFPFKVILPTILIVPIAATCPPSPAPRCPLLCWTIYRQSGLVHVFSSPEFLVFNAPPPLTCWLCKRGDVKVKKSQAPASAHPPETLGLIRELLPENLPNCRKLWRSAAGQITLWERGRQDAEQLQTWEMKPHLLIWKEGLRLNVSTFQHVQKK